MMTARILLPAFLALPLGAGATPATGYEPLAFLAGHCWKGTFPDGKQTDEHCFSWVYAGKFLRDVHTVHGASHPDFHGESLYFWNSATKELEYLYIEDQGGFSRGVVAAEPDALLFPPANYVEDGRTQTYRSRWQHAGDGAYDVVTEFKSGEGWVEGFRIHMVRGS